MNLKINNTNFCAQYNAYGKQTAKETDSAYSKEINKLIYNRATAVQAQSYMQTEEIQEKISALPEDSFVRLHTAIYNKKNNDSEFLNFSPEITFETQKLKDYMALKKIYGEEAISHKLSLNNDGTLNTKEINSWFDRLLNYFS